MSQIKVLVTGVFDLLHAEHVNFLRAAKAIGDILIVGIESDVRVKQLKGEHRPVWNQDRRVRELKKLKFVDQVFVLPTKFDSPADHEQLIGTIKPDILAVSSHSPHLEAKQRILAKFGGRVEVVHQHNSEVSTTYLINKEQS